MSTQPPDPTGLGRFGLLAQHVLRIFFNPLRRFGMFKLALFTILSTAMFAGKIEASWVAGRRSIKADLSDMNVGQMTILAATLIYLVAANRKALRDSEQMRQTNQEGLRAALASPDVSEEIKKEILNKMV